MCSRSFGLVEQRKVSVDGAQQGFHNRALALENSLPFGAYTAGGDVAGFARVVTDGAMFAYLRDVLVLPAHRGRGLGLALCRRALEHPDLAAVNNWLLRSTDSKGLYARLGFTPVDGADDYMRRQTAPVAWR